MARRRRGEKDKKSEMVAKGYIECRSCGELSAPGSTRCQSCRRLLPKGKRVLAMVVAVVVVSASFGGIYLLSQEQRSPSLTSVLEYSPSSASASVDSEIKVVFTREMNRTSVERSFSISPHINGTIEWRTITLIFRPEQPLANSTTYTVSIGKDARDVNGRSLDSDMFQWSFITDGPHVRRSIGMSADSFWIDRPPTMQSPSVTITHPQWVIDALDDGVVMILDHSETCNPCILQTSICNDIMDDDHDKLEFFDLLSGVSEPRATEVFMTYDPDGGMNYIPLTVIVTKVPDGTGGHSIAWHSWEGVVPKAIMESWISDAQDYYAESA